MRLLVSIYLIVFMAATSASAAGADSQHNPEMATPATAGDATDFLAVDTSLARVMDCCHPIRVLHGCLKYVPPCLDLRHECLTPYTPCRAETCLAPACHKPLAPCIPEDRSICLPTACHKPLTVFMPEDVCASTCAGECQHAADSGCDTCSTDSGSDPAGTASS